MKNVMHRILFYLLVFSIIIIWNREVSSQIIVLNSFDPTETGSLCGVGFDWETGNVWIYGCSDDSLYAYSAIGNLIASVPRPGEAANDADIAFAPEDLMLGDTSVPYGTLLFINGETDTAEIYAIDKNTGTVIDTLNSSFGNSHVVGGAFHPIRNTFYLLQDQVAGPNGNIIAEVNPVIGDTLQTFGTPAGYSVNYGDLDIGDSTSNLFIVSSIEDSIAELTAAGSPASSHALPGGVSLLSGIALDCAKGEAWVVNTAGTVFHLGGVPCGQITSIEETEAENRGFALDANYPNPFNPATIISFSLPSKSFVSLKVFDALGRELTVLVSEELAAGRYARQWSAEGFPSGVYFYSMQAGAFYETKKLILLR